MKLEVKNNLLVAYAENFNESVRLMELTKKEKTVETNKTRKKPLHLKKCEVCGKSYKGQQGLSNHTSRMHKNVIPVTSYLHE